MFVTAKGKRHNNLYFKAVVREPDSKTTLYYSENCVLLFYKIKVLLIWSVENPGA